MLRNHYPLMLLMRHFGGQHRYFHHHNDVLCTKNSSTVLRQGKVMSKLFGNRATGNKKRWIPSVDASPATAGILLKESQFGNKPNNSGGKNAIRRVTVLNKLFMKHITDLMATGEISESILGKGLQVSRVKISQDFAYVNVFWLSTGEVLKDNLLELELQRCSGILRHELSQLGLMGVVPRIKFVKDKLFTNAAQVETLLKSVDFGKEANEDEHTEYKRHASDLIKQDLFNSEEMPAITSDAKLDENMYSKPIQNNFENLKLPYMRHDVLGLDHKSIMLKIFTKMRKSKQAWEQHHQTQSDSRIQTNEQQPASINLSQPTKQLDKLNHKFSETAKNSDKFEAFLAKRRERKITPERKKYRQVDHHIDLATAKSNDNEMALSNQQKQRYEAEDYLFEDPEEKSMNRK